MLKIQFLNEIMSFAEAKLAKPTPIQLAWQDMEVGLFVHFDMFTYAPDWNWRSFQDPPKPELFNPIKLDTDQWLEAAKAIGAKYAVLTAKHCQGFCLWQTDAYDYGVKQSKWRDGKGDVVADFVESCHKYGIKAGIYYSVTANGYLGVDNPGRVKSGDPKDQAKYKAICEQQLRELWSRYGELAEVWFDGSSLPPEEGGPDIASLLKELQPNAVVFQSPQASIRWVGNEDGVAPYPCWNSVKANGEWGVGDPDGDYWCPAECDVPIRSGEWGWRPNQEHLVKPLDHLVDLYYRSVGHGCNLLLNSNPNQDGLIPDPDMKRYVEFGAEIKRRFSKSIAKTSGKGDVVELALDKPTVIDHVVTMEDIAQGECVREYVIEVYSSGEWKEACKGLSIGHKKIDKISPVEVSKIRWRCVKSAGEPIIRKFAAYFVG
jgi:alpha-L-fucosidase